MAPVRECPINFHSALSWRLMTEVTRRCPEQLRLYEARPGRDLPASLGVVDNHGRLLVALSEAGALHIHATWEGATRNELQEGFFLSDWGPGSFTKTVRALCGRLSIPSYKWLPPTTPAVLVYRYVAALLEQASFSSREWN